MMEVKLILAAVLSEFKFCETKNTPEVLEMDPTKVSNVSVKGDPILKVEKHNINRH